MPTLDDSPSPPSSSAGLAVLETVLIFLLFFLFAGWPPPDVNEAHYLAKAKHYWDPTWCAGDLFLESADAHLVFYWTFGWVTRLASLTTTAWIGRVVTWLLMAWSWRRLSSAVCPRPFVSVLTAALLLVLVSRLHMAGEWIVGGVEAKGFSYVLLFLGLEALVRGRWKAMFPLLGAATSFHVLVGGWALVAAAFAWLISGRREVSLVPLLPFLILAVALALPGLLPALLLTAGAPPEVAQQANLVYVYERLPHHLVIHRFPNYLLARQAALLLAWGAMAYSLRKQPQLQRLNAFVLGAAAIAITGVLIDQSLVNHLTLAASLLRYYWYRLSDAMLPLGAALCGVALVELVRQTKPKAAQGMLVVLALGSAACLLHSYTQKRSDMRPNSVQQAETRLNLSAEESATRFRDWVAACQWVSEHTTPNSCFLTPRWQQSFKWYAGRCEVVSWKDVPQDAEGLLAWRTRLRDVYPPIVSVSGHAALPDEQLRDLAGRYGADYLLVDRTRQKRSLPFPLVYPIGSEVNHSFALYRIPKTRQDAP